MRPPHIGGVKWPNVRTYMQHRRFAANLMTEPTKTKMNWFTAAASYTLVSYLHSSAKWFAFDRFHCNLSPFAVRDVSNAERFLFLHVCFLPVPPNRFYFISFVHAFCLLRVFNCVDRTRSFESFVKKECQRGWTENLCPIKKNLFLEFGSFFFFFLFTHWFAIVEVMK